MGERVAVLGGGIAGLTAAFELTATPELRARYDVTVYSPGWRLGGKGASGRNADHGQRIEEHGLHIWFGFYTNAFNVMQRAYDEAARPAGAPLATWDEAFKPCDDVVLYELWEDAWWARSLHAPRNDRTPGEFEPIDFSETLELFVGWLRFGWQTFVDRPDVPTDVPPAMADEVLADDTHLALAMDEADGVDRRELGEGGPTELLRTAARIVGSRWLEGVVCRLLRTTADVAGRLLRSRFDDPEVRFFYEVLDLGSAVVTGILEDDLLERGFSAANGEELTAWMRRHGASEATVARSSLLRGLYDLAFGFTAGDPTRPDMAAGSAVEVFVRILLGYRGAMLWKMQAGMGDAVFAPLYEVLQRRGVRIELFHAATDLRLSPDRQAVETIDVVRQVDLADGVEEYRPFVDVKGLACWPSQPDWNQLADGDRLRSAGVDLERTVNPLGRPITTLRRGTDFDRIVLAIPPPALEAVTAELAADPGNPRFATMLASARTVATQAFQLWAGPGSDDLGATDLDRAVVSSFVEPLDTYADMTYLLEREDWAPGTVELLGYITGVLPDVTDEDQARADQRVHDAAVRFVEGDLPELWKRLRAGGGPLRWDVLVGTGNGPARLEAQYWRANISGSERYVQTPAGSVEHRLAADESGYENLVLAGDWTRNGIDGGCIEAAVMSGRQAARAISGWPEVIPGEHGILNRRR